MDAVPLIRAAEPLIERRAMTSDGPDGAAVDDKLGAVDRRGAIRGQIGDEVGDLIGLSRTPDRDSRPER